MQLFLQDLHTTVAGLIYLLNIFVAKFVDLQYHWNKVEGD